MSPRLEFSMSRFAVFSWAFIAVACLSATARTDDVPAENPEDDNIVSGTIVSLTTEDRLTTLVVDIDGENQEFRLTRQIGFQVQGPGDAGFLTEGNYVETRAIMSNDRLFPETLTVHILGRGQRAPAGIIQEVAREDAGADNRYDISGTISGVAQDEQYPEYTQVAIRSVQNAVIFVREEQALTVSFNGHEHAAAGDPIEMQVMRLRNGRINLQACRVTKSEAFDSATILGTQTEE
jgi:hypothetical protein